MTDRPEETARTSISPAMRWTIALIAPLVLSVALQFLLYEFRPIGRFIEHLPPLLGKGVLLSLVLGPSYVLLFATGSSNRLRNIGIFSALLLVYVPPLWLFALYASCFLFSLCV